MTFVAIALKDEGIAPSRSRRADGSAGAFLEICKACFAAAGISADPDGAIQAFMSGASVMRSAIAARRRSSRVSERTLKRPRPMGRGALVRQDRQRRSAVRRLGAGASTDRAAEHVALSTDANADPSMGPSGAS